MDTEQAVRLSTKIADKTRDGFIGGHDAMYSPYIDLITHGMKIYHILGYEKGSAFMRGFRDKYVRFLNGEDPATIKSSIPQWLQTCGLAPVAAH